MPLGLGFGFTFVLGFGFTFGSFCGIAPARREIARPTEKTVFNTLLSVPERLSNCSCAPSPKLSPTDFLNPS